MFGYISSVIVDQDMNFNNIIVETVSNVTNVARFKRGTEALDSYCFWGKLI